MLEAVHLTKRYASLPAVQDLSFSLRPGQVLGCLGPNGSGKSTTVKMLTGLLQPTRGIVQFDGHNIQENLAAYRKRLGYVPEEAAGLRPRGAESVSVLDRLGVSRADWNAARDGVLGHGKEDRFSAGVVLPASATARQHWVLFERNAAAPFAHLRDHRRS